jgi:(S)-ureidoglycine aminohydrolase
MHSLGHTRSANRRDHLLHTPDAFVRTPLPGLAGGTAIVHISPAAGAAFTQFTVELEPGGTLAPATTQRFIYVLSGEINLSSRKLSREISLSSRKPSAELSAAMHGLPARLQAQKNSLTAGRYAYLPPASSFLISARKAARLAVIEKSYQPLQGAAAPQLLIGREADVAPTALNGDPDLQVRALLPDSPAFDFAVNTMAYQPGASLSQVEVHVMEHGLLMLEGGGIYRLGDGWYPVTAGDFIWMAPFCPQWFGALGKAPAKYLIYKDWNRHPLT